MSRSGKWGARSRTDGFQTATSSWLRSTRSIRRMAFELAQANTDRLIPSALQLFTVKNSRVLHCEKVPLKILATETCLYSDCLLLIDLLGGKNDGEAEGASLRLHQRPRPDPPVSRVHATANPTWVLLTDRGWAGRSKPARQARVRPPSVLVLTEVTFRVTSTLGRTARRRPAGHRRIELEVSRRSRHY